MERIIGDRKRQLSQMKQILKMQDLLEQYDRQNEFLNRQVDTLLKENIKLKQQNSLMSTSASKIMFNDNYQSKGSKKSFALNDQSKHSTLSKPRKSKYEYLFDQKQIKDFKNSIKSEIKKDAQKSTSTKEIQTAPQQIVFTSAFSPNQISFSINKPQQKSVLKDSNFTPIKRQSQVRQAQNNLNTKSLSKSKSKSKQKSPKKLDIISKSRIYEQQIKVPPIKPNIKSPVKQDTDTKKQQTLVQKFQFSQSQVLQHSFGHKSQHKMQKKVTLLESDLPSGLKQHKQMSESRMTNKFIPLSIQSKQLSTNIPKSQMQSFHYQTSVQRSDSKPKRNHSLNPSPKVQLQPNKFIPQKIKPFVLKTQEAFQETPSQLQRNPSDRIKRKFIKIVSSQKISVEDSPKKK